MSTATAGEIFHCSGFVLDLERGTLSRGSEALFLRPKAFALLTHFVRNVGRVVPKEELMDAVWPGVFVTEGALTQSIREIRKVLGDNLIRTVSKRGYMLAVESEPTAPPIAEAGSQPIVAVLRFLNESRDPADTAIVDGIGEDIINGLARFYTLTVLARNSSFSFSSYTPAERPQSAHALAQTIWSRDRYAGRATACRSP
jgi:DNA-binding winged helix-turn-helix (wHTH) protein